MGQYMVIFSEFSQFFHHYIRLILSATFIFRNYKWNKILKKSPTVVMRGPPRRPPQDSHLREPIGLFRRRERHFWPLPRYLLVGLVSLGGPASCFLLPPSCQKYCSKGQLISKCLYGVIVPTKKPTRLN